MLEPDPLPWFDVVLRVAVPNVAARFQFLNTAPAVVATNQPPGFRFAPRTPIAPPATAVPWMDSASNYSHQSTPCARSIASSSNTCCSLLSGVEP